MADTEQAQWIVPTNGALTLPVIEILTGRGFITGKSGSGKSNTASVIAEELLKNNYNLLIIDPEGEYFGLKEKFEILHVGNDDRCDVQVSPNHAEQLATIALERNMPVIVDVSDYLDADESTELIANTVRALFQKEKNLQKPFLLMIEEMQEYLPQRGGNDELGELLERVAKRGRKRGLGMLGISQRPSSVDKDFITQCDWMVWHRLTWQNDIGVVKNVLGSEIASEVEDLETGEGYLMTDWDESVERVKFKRKETHDAGATPGLETYERPDLKSVSQNLIREIERGASGSTSSSTPPPADHELSEDAQAALADAVESVETDEDRFESNGADTDNPVSPITESSTQPLDIVSNTDEVDIGSMDPEELSAHVSNLQRENQILEDEVRELRTLLQSVDQSSPRTSQPDHSVTTVEDKSDKPIPSKPVPPNPPVEREGIAGNLVELVSMVGYLSRSLQYRVKLLVHRARYGKKS